MPKISVYLNNRASSLDTEYWRTHISKRFYRYEILFHEPRSIEEFNHFLDEDIHQKVKTIFCLGGDGTVNLVLQKIFKQGIQLFVIPSGTANDLASEMGVFSNIDQVSKLYRYGSFKHVDIIDINGKKMVTTGGLGLASLVSEKVNELRERYPIFKLAMRKTKSEIYNLVMAKELLLSSIPLLDLEISSPDLPSIVHTPSYLLLVSNQSAIARKFVIAPERKNDDGFFSVTVFKHTNKFLLGKTILGLRYKGIIDNEDNVLAFQTKELTIKVRNETIVSFLGDGEILDQSHEFKIKIFPKSQSICYYDPEVDYITKYDLTEISAI